MDDLVFEDVYVVNNVEITVSREIVNGVDVLRFPDLFKIDKLGRTAMWRIFVIGDQIFSESGIKNGKIREYPGATAQAKNVGRANETTGQEQALFEAFSTWKRKKDQLYTEGESETEEKGAAEDANVGARLRPMLAEKWTDKKSKAKFPGAVSPKLDGVRVMAYKNEEGEIVMTSRLGKEYQHMNRIRDEIKVVLSQFNVVLDGELYSHNIPFNAISGAVRSTKKPSKYDDVLEYYVFDVWNPVKPEMTYQERMDLLREVCAVHLFKQVRFLFYDTVNNEKEVHDFHTKYVAEGYEGLMFRNFDSPYVLGRRVVHLLKYKEFEDKEFKVVDVVEGTATEAGAAVFVCLYDDGRTLFNVRPRGSIEKRKYQFKNKDKYIGKMLTVRYQTLPEDGNLPRFPVGIKFDTDTEGAFDVSSFEAVGFRDYE